MNSKRLNKLTDGQLALMNARRRDKGLPVLYRNPVYIPKGTCFPSFAGGNCLGNSNLWK